MIHDLFTGCVLEMNVVKSVGWKISKLYKSRNQSIKLLDTRKTDIHTEGSPRAAEFTKFARITGENARPSGRRTDLDRFI